jgi:hypothetical protein
MHPRSKEAIFMGDTVIKERSNVISLILNIKMINVDINDVIKLQFYSPSFIDSEQLNKRSGLKG